MTLGLSPVVRISLGLVMLEVDTKTVLAATASFGVASSQFGARTPQELFNQADESLYRAKRTGRNRF